MKCFGDLQSPGNLKECTSTVKAIFDKLNGMQRFCKFIVEEIHIKPSIRYYQYYYYCSKAARTVLSIMIDPLMGAPAFVAGLLPVYKLSADFLYKHLRNVIKIVRSCSGFCLALTSDNYRVTQKCFSTFKSNFRSSNTHSSNQPIKNVEFDSLFLIYDPVHLLKYIRNNRQTEKMQMLQFDDHNTGRVLKSKWRLVYSL